MICFPLDNTEYTANALGAWCGTRTRGVFSADDHYSVAAGSGMAVVVNPGLAWLKADTYWGVCAFEINPTTITIDTSDGSLRRIDVVCLRLDKNTNTCAIVVKKGAYSTAPVITPPVRNVDYDEIYVAAVTVRNGATSIRASDIADVRLDEYYCGIMRDGVAGIPTQALYDQWTATFEASKAEMQQTFAEYQQMVQTLYDQYQAAITANESSAQEALAAYLAALDLLKQDYVNDTDQWLAQFKSDLTAWFADLQNQLDDNQATNLYNMIYNHQQASIASEAGVHGQRYWENKLQVYVGSGWVTLVNAILGYSWAYIDSLNNTWEQWDDLDYTWEQFESLIESEAV